MNTSNYIQTCQMSVRIMPRVMLPNALPDKSERLRRQHTHAYISTGAPPAASPLRTRGEWWEPWGWKDPQGQEELTRWPTSGHETPSPVWFLSPQSWALEQGNTILSLFYQNVRALLIRDLSFYSVSHFWTCDSSGTPKVSLCFLGVLITQGIQANEELLIGNNS